MSTPTVQMSAQRTCSVDACDRAYAARGWCFMHYARWKRHGDPLVMVRPELEQTESERFWAKVVPGSAGCRLWTAATTSNGYGRFLAAGRRPVLAHRWAYEETVGPIPNGLTLDHLCRTRACVEVMHLEPVTNRENVLRGEGFAAQNARKTHCKRGHGFTPENTALRKDGSRVCRMCRSVRR